MATPPSCYCSANRQHSLCFLFRFPLPHESHPHFHDPSYSSPWSDWWPPLCIAYWFHSSGWSSQCCSSLRTLSSISWANPTVLAFSNCSLHSDWDLHAEMTWWACYCLSITFPYTSHWRSHSPSMLSSSAPSGGDPFATLPAYQGLAHTGALRCLFRHANHYEPPSECLGCSDFGHSIVLHHNLLFNK